jgi:PAS domain S-box-containing protein
MLVLGAGAVLFEVVAEPERPASVTPDQYRQAALVGLVLLAGAVAFVVALIVQRAQARALGQRHRDLEGQLRMLQQQMDQTERVAEIGSWEWDLDGKRVSWSDEMFDILGVKRGDFEPTLDGYLRRVPSEDRESVRRAMRQARAGEPFELKHRLLRPDGEVRTVIERGAVLADEGHGAVRIRGTTQDITDQRNLEDRLQMRREIYMSLLEAQSDLGQGALMAEGDRILYVNSALQSLLAKEPSDRESLSALLAAIDSTGQSDLRREIEVRRDRALPPGQGEARVLLAGGTYVDLEFVIDSISLGGRLRTVALVRDVTQRKQADAELRRTREQLQLFSLELARVREEESTRIAREIHDELGQRLTGLKMDLAWVASRLRHDESQTDVRAIADKIEEMTGLADDTIKEVRRISTELRPGVLDDLGFAAALEWQCQEFSRRTSIPCEVLAPADVPLTEEATTALFRITQEALTNVSRHALASKVNVRLTEEMPSSFSRSKTMERVCQVRSMPTRSGCWGWPSEHAWSAALLS